MHISVLHHKIAGCLEPVKESAHSGYILLRIMQEVQSDPELTPSQQVEICSIIIDSIQ